MVHQDRTHNVPHEHRARRTGQWLPTDQRVHRDWVSRIISATDANPSALHPIIAEFKSLIETTPRLYMLVSSMFEQVPYAKDLTGHKQVRDHEHMLLLFNHLLTRAPEWSDSDYGVGMVGTPFNALLDWPMGTPSGFAFFLDPDVNAMMKKVLNAWAEFLSSPDSKYVLSTSDIGWFSPHGTEDLCATANVGQTSWKFEELFQCDTKDEYHGYKSWDDFFTRSFHWDKRPVAAPEDDSVIANACESKPYNVARDVAARDRFWLKGQPYSLVDMLANDPLYAHFVGGTIYQAFLSALSYHRWHAPVSGTIKKAYVVGGTYFSEPLFEGLGDPSKSNKDIDAEGEKTGQGYLTATATRAIMFIEADNEEIGLMCFLGIGMTEVSTCDITVKEGQHVKKGEELGMFHYGGSTHCVIFRKGLVVEGFPDIGGEENFPVRAKLAVVKGSK